MVKIVIKRKNRKSAKRLAGHLEEEHPSTRGKIKVKNTKRKLKMRSKSLKAQAIAVTKTNISL